MTIGLSSLKLHVHFIFHNNQFIDYKDLIQTYGIERHEFLKYLQLKSIIKSKMNTTHNPLESPKIIDDIIKLTDLKKLTSKLYKLILTIDKSIIVAITHWNKDLNISPSTDFWTEINQNIFTMTSNTNLQLIQYKIIHRTHITQYKMYKMGLANTDTCYNAHRAHQIIISTHSGLANRFTLSGALSHKNSPPY